MTTLWERRWLILSVLCFVAIAISLYFNWERTTGSPQFGDPNHELSRALVTELIDLAPDLEREENIEIMALFCRVLEGTQCYFMPARLVPDFDFAYNPELETERNRLPDALEEEVVRQLDPRHIERAQNNTVVLHCRRQGVGLLTCTINGGGEAWYPVRLTDSPRSFLIR